MPSRQAALLSCSWVVCCSSPDAVLAICSVGILVAVSQSSQDQRTVLIQEVLDAVLPNVAVSKQTARTFLLGDESSSAIHCVSALVLQMMQVGVACSALLVTAAEAHWKPVPATTCSTQPAARSSDCCETKFIGNAGFCATTSCAFSSGRVCRPAQACICGGRSLLGRLI